MARILKALVLATIVLASTIALPSKPVAAADTYAGTVLNDSPDAYYRLGDATNATVNDSSGNGRNAIVSNSAGFIAGIAGAPKGDTDTAQSLNGSQYTYAVDPQQVSNPTTFTEAVWFKTTSTTGGRIFGFGDKNGVNQTASSYDRHVWMSSNGTLIFGVNPSSPGLTTVSSASGFNDGQWHFLATTLSSSGAQLYVDGTMVAQNTSAKSGQVFNGYWSLGWGNLNAWPANPGSVGLNGSFDEWAVWNSVALSANQIKAHYVAGTAVGFANVQTVVDPSFSFTVATHSGACNSFAQTAGASSGATGVALGRVNSATGSVAAQDLSVGTNANSGFSLQMRSPSALTSGTNTIASTSGSNATPAAFPATSTAAFGYTVSGLSRFTSAWAAPETINREVMNGATVGTITNCIAYRVQVTASTPAGTYATTAIYTAVPTF